MKTLPKIVSTGILTLLFFGLSSWFGPVLASSSDLNQKHIDALSLVVPNVTDDPNQTITFSPISGETIELQIDNNGFNEISSPYKFTSLTIGSHKLDFKYLDATEINQTFSIYMVVIPREARFSPPTLIFDEGAAVTFSGTALPSAEVEIWLIGNSEVIYKTVNVDSEGNWNIDLSGLLVCGKYQLVSMVRKNGLSSSTSAPLNISYCKEGTTLVNDDKTTDFINFDFVKLWENFINTVQQHGGLVIAGVGILLLGLGGGLVYSSISVKRVKAETRKILVSAIRGEDILNTGKKPSVMAEQPIKPQKNEKVDDNVADDVLEQDLVEEDTASNTSDDDESKTDKPEEGNVNLPDEVDSGSPDTLNGKDTPKSMENIPKKSLANLFGLLKKKEQKTDSTSLSSLEESSEVQSDDKPDIKLGEKSEIGKSEKSSKPTTKPGKNIEKSLKSDVKEISQSNIEADKSKKTASIEKEIKKPENRKTETGKSDIKEPTARLSRDEFLAKFNQLQKKNTSKSARISLADDE